MYHFPLLAVYVNTAIVLWTRFLEIPTFTYELPNLCWKKLSGQKLEWGSCIMFTGQCARLLAVTRQVCKNHNLIKDNIWKIMRSYLFYMINNDCLIHRLYITPLYIRLSSFSICIVQYIFFFSFPSFSFFSLFLCLLSISFFLSSLVYTLFASRLTHRSSFISFSVTSCIIPSICVMGMKL